MPQNQDATLANRMTATERKLVTVLFADIVASSALVSGRDPEEADQILQPVIDTMTASVRRYDGMVAQVFGDGILGMFGAPSAQEDHALRACLAAQEMMRAGDDLGGQERCSIRIGIASGEVVTQMVEDAARNDRRVVGECIHLAAKLQQRAEPGSILIAEATLALAGPALEVTQAGSLRLNPDARPISFHRLVAAWAERRTHRDVQFSGTGVTDLTPLSGLSKLTRLDLSGTGVTDLSPLSRLSELEWLSLSGAGVKDRSPVKMMEGLDIVGFDPPKEGRERPTVEPVPPPPAKAAIDSSRPAAPPLSDRVRLVFDDPRRLRRALFTEAPGFSPRVVSRRRNFIAVERPAGMVEDQFLDLIARFAKRTGARLVRDFRYSLEERPPFSPTHTLGLTGGEPGGTLSDVLARIGADAVDDRIRGGGVSIAIVDTGVNGNRAEFPPVKRAGEWAPDGESAWTDEDGHGTMCATIATATATSGGAFRGVAPDARLIACRTWFYSSELADIYDTLADRAAAGEVIVASNSFGIPEGKPPEEPEDHDLFKDALTGAIEAGVRVVFSAGNYHDLAGGVPDACGPNTVWLDKGRADVLTVAACDLDGAMWSYSSRGPGQFFGAPGTGRKPDVTAPTPRNGVILFGDETVIMPDGWGTSGAAPQVVGLLALLLSVRPDLPRDELFDIVCTTARPLGFAHECGGHGLIDCRAALNRLARLG